MKQEFHLTARKDPRSKSHTGGQYFTLAPRHIYVYRREIYQMYREGEIVYKGEVNEARVCLDTLKEYEEKTGSTALLNRIIRGGGFINYIERLEHEASHRL